MGWGSPLGPALIDEPQAFLLLWSSSKPEPWVGGCKEPCRLFFAAWAMLWCQCNRASSVLVELFHQRGELDAKVWFIFFSHCFAVFVDLWALPQTCLPRFSFMFVLGLLTNLLILVNGGKADFSSLASSDSPLPDHCKGWKPTETKIGEK